MLLQRRTLVCLTVILSCCCPAVFGDDVAPDMAIPGGVQPGSLLTNTENSDGQATGPGVPVPVPDEKLVPEVTLSIGDVPHRADLRPPLPGQPQSTDAFNSVPEIREIDSIAISDTSAQANFLAVFEDPCHFNYVLPGRYSQQIVRDTLLVYEGMEIAVTEDGSYTVSFIAEVPQIPVVLNLQLSVSTSVNGATLPRGTITLPPVVIESRTLVSRDQPGRSVKVTRKGYSQLLHRIIANESATGISFKRAGNARFGSVPPEAKYSILDPANTQK